MGARITDVNTIIQAGINPKTGLPLKAGGVANSCELKANIKKQLRVIDEQTAINRFKWKNLPYGLNSQLLERVLYYKGQGAFFYMPSTEKFYFLPYALDGTIDVYGRFMGITPLPFAGGTTRADGKEKPWITGLNRVPVYDIMLDEVTEEIFETSCVLLKDYSPQYSENIISRQILNDPLLETMSECIPFMRTALIAGTGIKGMRVDDADQQREVENAARAITDAALNADMFVPVVAPVELQELTSQNLSKAEEYMLALQALDNFRLSTYGLDNGGLFQKKQQMLQSEQEMNGCNGGLVYQDSLTIRQTFCNIVNSIWGLDIWCEEVETNETKQTERDDINKANKEEAGNDYSGQDDSAVRE